VKEVVLGENGVLEGAKPVQFLLIELDRTTGFPGSM
jgi:hypothetical protein